MNEEIIKQISAGLNVKATQVSSTLKLLSEGNTIPFIARYRKEVTGNLDEEQIRKINDVYEYQVNLLKRKEDVIRLIAEKDLMTPELEKKIMDASKLVEVEDIYRPFKEKKKTKATDAINNGLEPLAKMFMMFPDKIDCGNFINDKVKNEEEAIEGTKYIIAEWISDNAYYRKWIRGYFFRNGVIISKMKKNALDELKVYEMYYDYSEAVKMIKPHRILAMNRGEKEKILNISIDVDTNDILSYLEERIVKNKNNVTYKYVVEAIADSYKRLISPSIEREVRSELTEEASDVAIDVFAKNLEKLLLQPPMKEKIVLGFDPAYRTGCKLAIVDNTGKNINVSVIYPHEPRNEYDKSKKRVLDLIDKYKIDIIAIGNGTASRESEAFIVDVIKEAKRKVEFIIVSEAGASVYSASPLAIEEFPDLHVEERSAISIARRLQDPLSELVKIDSKSIGVGQYQHDVAQNKLNESLDFVVTKAVNQVGVNVNTASNSLLKYVSGLSKKMISNILEYRDTNGKINSREELKKKKILTPKAYEQAIGFIRVVDGVNPLDKTSIHPESYDVTIKLLKSLDLAADEIGSDKMIEKLELLNIEGYSNKLGVDIYTLEDIVKSLKQPNRDPREEFDKPLLKSDILNIEDLKKGMKLQGTVRNVVDFGVFIDIGLKNDGLAHISKLTNHFIKHPLEVVSVGDIVDCYVEDIFVDKKKVSLSLIEPKS
ncbi:MAG: Tex family protein [Bacilli bacterium]|nr:Tex family protein [Bacilli bacterium]MDD4053891.1 Tex family protein [Bacilli bacterium]